MHSAPHILGMILAGAVSFAALEAAPATSAHGFANTFGNSVASDTLPSCDYSNQELAQQILVQGPSRHSGDYLAPTSADLTALQLAVTATHEGRLVDAQTQAQQADYMLCSSIDDAGVTVLRPVDLTVGDAVVLIRANADSDTTIEVPYVHSKVGAAPRALATFAKNRAQAVVLSGTHRCGSVETVAGTAGTSACGRDGAARISDMGLAPHSTFRIAADTLRHAGQQASPERVATGLAAQGVGHRG
jgi:hypothetical protein